MIVIPHVSHKILVLFKLFTSVQFQFQFYDVYSKHILFGHCDHHCKFSFIHSVHKDGISEFINSNS